ncbi:glycerol acyltransferase [Rubrobacter indicoceani]|uniref:glycerol acyltransferase n=1 Tax=Rubrobacter indicoceani TaxID=2051957 RepID=UPI000E5C044B|nr:glycerol acyltransferase [Rubrobacter indicoceani]
MDFASRPAPGTAALPERGERMLVEICAGELLEAFGASGDNVVFSAVARYAVGRVARQAAEYDRLVGAGGLGPAGSWALGRMVGEASFSGEGGIPIEGPLVIASNHPGLSDAIALFSAIPRDDLMVIAARRDFLDALPNTTGRLFIVEDGADGLRGSQVVRAAARHLRDGGSLLTFPGGRIEPDPASMDGAVRALSGWSESLDLFARLVPGLKIVPAVVSGVVSRSALGNPLVYLRRNKEDRLWLAATLQLMFPALYRTDVRVTFGRAIACPATSRHRSGVSAEVVRRAEALISAR